MQRNVTKRSVNNMKYKIGIIGAFRLSGIPKGGQEVKTCIIANALEDIYGNIRRFDTWGKRNHLMLPLHLLRAVFTCSNIIILPAHKGLIVESILLRWANIFFHRSLHYIVIGGWLPEHIKKHTIAANSLKHFHGIYVETNTMLKSIQELGFNNIYVLPNCKPLNILKGNISKTYSEPLQLVTFSRVTEKKGIADAVKAVQQINAESKRLIYSLDIYGSIDKEDEIWFDDLKKTFTSEITYKGYASYEKTENILKEYFALLFPTHYMTEGIPGTIIDAYAAGIPVICSMWNNFPDVVEQGVTGYGYEFNQYSELINILKQIADDPTLITKLKNNCLNKAREYQPHEALKPLLHNIF